MSLATSLALTLALAASGCSSGSGTPAAAPAAKGSPSSDEPQGAVRRYTYEVVKRYPHDRKAYTQGLLWHDGQLYESTGRHGESSVRRVELESGKVLARHDLPYDLFGEGIAIWKDLLVQLTWKSGQAIVYDRRSFAELYRKPYEGEGWGLCAHGEWLVMSDGTDALRFLDPKTFEEHHRIRVRRGNTRAWSLNELESIEGELWANVYQSEEILRIDPETGKVTGVIELPGLQAKQGVQDRVQDVLNGIAYDAAGQRVFITGKYWPNLYEIRVKPRQ